MRIHEDIERYRIKTGVYASSNGFTCGAFIIPFQSRELTIIASDGSMDGWEHVSVSLPNRCPNWQEMSYVKSVFWDDEDCVVQFHAPKSKYVNNHPYCLHLWKKKDEQFEMPSPLTVGVPGLKFEV